MSKTQEKMPQRETFQSFSLILLKLHFGWKISPKDRHNQDLFSKIRTHFLIFKKARGGLVFPPSYAPVNVAEYTSITPNIPKYPWKSLKNLFWIWYGSEYTWSSYMFGRLLKMPWVTNKPGFLTWHGYICKGYAEFQICLIMAPYASIMSGHASICLSVSQYAWTWLNTAEYPKIWMKMSE